MWLDSLRKVVRRSPLAPAARRLRALLYPPTSKQRNQLYDQQTVEVMKRVLATDSTAIDVGAHKGSVLTTMVEMAPRGRHFAFEPIPQLAAALEKRFPTVSVFDCALGDSVGTATFELAKNAPGYSGLRRRSNYDFRHPLEFEQIVVHTQRLDNILSPDARVAFIKIDVEGGEYHVMKGAVQTITRCRPVIVFEASRISTGAYGVTPTMLYRFITAELGMCLSTMARWLNGSKPYSERQLVANWDYGPDFYYIAYYG